MKNDKKDIMKNKGRAEPLKGKGWSKLTQEQWSKRFFDFNQDRFSEEDIRSAVEWCKKEIQKEFLGKPVEIFEIIDEAFEDVMKSEE